MELLNIPFALTQNGAVSSYAKSFGLLWWLSGREVTCRRRKRCRFHPWVEQPTPVFLPGEPHGQRSLAECGPWGHRSLVLCTRSVTPALGYLLPCSFLPSPLSLSSSTLILYLLPSPSFLLPLPPTSFINTA